MKEALGVLVGLVVLFLSWYFFDMYLTAQHMRDLEACFGNPRCTDLPAVAKKAQPVQCVIRAPGFSQSLERRLFAMNDVLRLDIIDATGKMEDLHAIRVNGTQYVWQGEGTIYRGQIPAFDEVSQEPTVCTKLIAPESFFEVPAAVLDPNSVMPSRNR